MAHLKTKGNLNTVLGWLIFAIIAGFIFLHLSPSIAVRAKLVESGYVKSALTAKIVAHPDEAPYNPNLKRRNSDEGIAYSVSPSPVSKAENIELHQHPNRFIVKTFGLSFAEMMGEG